MCRKVIGYKKGSTDAFANYCIEDAYVDGVSLTNGHSPYHHIWTFASAVDKSDQYSTSGWVYLLLYEVRSIFHHLWAMAIRIS